MRELKHFFDNNAAWAARMAAQDPDFFTRLTQGQSPELLWIGCSDSRVPANQVIDVPPGEVFVHRNVANVVVHSDLNCLSVIQYAVEALQVKHIIVCGHYECGGVRGALRNDRLGLINNWLCHIQDVASTHRPWLDSLEDEHQQWRQLCVLNAVEQALNVCQTTIVQDAWMRGQSLCVHGWIYGLQDGLLHDLKFCVSDQDQVDATYQESIAYCKSLVQSPSPTEG